MTDEKLAEKWIAEYTGVDAKTQKAIQLKYHKNLKEAYLAGRQSNNEYVAELEEMNADLKQSLDWANERENENVELIRKLKKYAKLLQDICTVMGNDIYMVSAGLESRVKILWDASEEKEGLKMVEDIENRLLKIKPQDWAEIEKW